MSDVKSVQPPQPDGARFGASSGEGLPAHAPATYYERPLLKKPHWEWEVVTYLFMGGIMGGTGMLVALADDTPEREADLARSARYIALVLAAACPAILIKHLGRPERFLNMLRIFKLKSPMSLGVWALIAFSSPAAVAAAGQASRDGLLPGWIAKLAPRPVSNLLQGAFGAFIAGYTGVLVSATAIPIWACGKRHIPGVSVCSGLASACALNAAVLALTGGSQRTLRKLELLELVASISEAAILESFRRHAGSIGDPMFRGKRGDKLRTFTLFGGIIGASVLNLLPFGGKAKTVLASTLTLVGGYVLRETIIESGKASADDPRAASRQPE